ncbi:large ribosomal subunit protein bL12m-like [Diadema antillarum]|uniref:large ribosomal subunit protein bL12m-like n=1 Tax=Diadema antillarum TaxID=105358 RepID=UPI003A8C7215
MRQHAKLIPRWKPLNIPDGHFPASQPVRHSCLAATCSYYSAARHKKFVCALGSQRCHSSEAITAPARDNEDKQYSDKIRSLVDEIASLTLVEVSDLNQLLKKTLNIQDAPVMAVGAVPGVAAPALEQEEEEVDAVKTVEKTQFTVKLTKYDEATKVKLIKEIKALTSGMNLVQAKKFVEAIPQVVKADIGKTEAEEIKKQLEAAGATCEIE